MHDRDKGRPVTEGISQDVADQIPMPEQPGCYLCEHWSTEGAESLELKGLSSAQWGICTFDDEGSGKRIFVAGAGVPALVTNRHFGCVDFQTTRQILHAHHRRN